MRHRRSQPWIHRWSRQIIGAIAAIGVLETAVLTVAELTGSAAAICPTAGCKEVLSSQYATVFGLPLTLFGLLSYAILGIAAAVPLLVNRETNKQLRSDLEQWTWLLLFAGSTAMVVGSSYLMYVMAFKIEAFCPYCIASAFLSSSLFVLSIIGYAWEDIGQLLLTGLVVGMVTAIGVLGVYANVDSPTTAGGKGVPPLITNTSGSAEIALARHLKQIGARNYSAYWCPHCHEQKELFGKEAANLLDYIECARDGQNSQTERCQASGIQGFPTWEIDGKFYAGIQSLARLADLSGYSGPRNFQR